MKNIIFVDDEKRILDGLRRMLRVKRNDWRMTFVDHASKAEEMIDQEDFDVIVSDMRMPEIDGATLLTRIKEKHPHVIRIILSGHTELEAAIRAVPVAHQFLSKPCNSESLIEIIERTCRLQNVINSDRIKDIIGKIDRLPTVPATYSTLTEKLADPDCSIKEIAEIIEKDPSISAKILQLVNSAFFGLSRQISNIQTAISQIGMNMLKNLVLSVEIFRSFEENTPTKFSIEEIQEISLSTAKIAKTITDDKKLAEDAYIAGILHQIGELILAYHLTEEFNQVRQLMKTKPELSQNQAELEVIGITHAEIGAYLLGIWGIPYNVIEAVANYMIPNTVPHESFDIVDVVAISAALAPHIKDIEHGKMSPEQAMEILSNKGWGEDYLTQFGIIENLPLWLDKFRAMDHDE